MKKYLVTLTKSYRVAVVAENEAQARFVSEFYTNDIADISTEEDRQQQGFLIEQIECGINEAVNCEVLNANPQ